MLLRISKAVKTRQVFANRQLKVFTSEKMLCTPLSLRLFSVSRLFVGNMSSCLVQQVCHDLRRLSRSHIINSCLDTVISKQILFFVMVLSSIQADMKSDNTPKAFANRMIHCFQPPKIRLTSLYGFKGSQEPLHISFCEKVASGATPLFGSLALVRYSHLKMGNL